MQLSGIFRKVSVADLGKSELALDHSEGVFDHGAHVGFELLDSFQDSVGLQWGEPTALAGPPAIARLGIDPLNQYLDLFLRHYPIHLD